MLIYQYKVTIEPGGTDTANWNPALPERANPKLSGYAAMQYLVKLLVILSTGACSVAIL
jgi:hypothetical protein